ncbi:MAG: tRNA dihydrouridine(20/20a) synthase DusA [Pseudomonadales bacterium]|jgi:tRNA-dihydrouridine synthase A|nr:tRNA dihydrouridine(20/20a) synthase DusA [Gammaproteobacteria bacterium]MBP6053736.1 tRNA dihydrouridine(20/20a) synthase DusA [Pseudomonadales bacterium]MBP6229130.1 tRNA dihydrouridine(20/20a) synthase DusA [Pseudomonadales bacterium]
MHATQRAKLRSESSNRGSTVAESLLEHDALRWRLCVAPMMEWTDRHCRYFLRLITRHALLYTEMVTSAAIVHGDREHLLGFDALEQPLALQLGGSDPREMAESARIGEQWGYREININVGCPSDRVQSGRFGACLMAEPELVAHCVAAMRAAVSVPVTVKCRIGIDDRDSYAELQQFVSQVAEAGCETFVIHARKAWLSGLSPKQNREIPPLDYPTVYRVKQDFPTLTVVINGGIDSLEAAAAHLCSVDGVMLGRAAYHNPYLLAAADALLFDDHHVVPSRHEILEAFLPYVERQLAGGRRLCQISRHVLGLFQACPGGRRFRRHIAEHGYRDGAGIEVLRDAAACVSRMTLPDDARLSA